MGMEMAVTRQESRDKPKRIVHEKFVVALHFLDLAFNDLYPSISLSSTSLQSIVATHLYHC